MAPQFSRMTQVTDTHAATVIVKDDAQLQLYCAGAGAGEAAIVNKAVEWAGAWQPELCCWGFPATRLSDLVLLLTTKGVQARIIDAANVGESSLPLAALITTGQLMHPNRYLAHALGRAGASSAQLALWVDEMRQRITQLLCGQLPHSEGQRLYLAANERMLEARTDDEANAAIAVTSDLLAALNTAISLATSERKQKLTLAGWDLGGE